MLVRKLQETKTRYCGLSFFNNMELSLECAFLPAPGIGDRNEFTSDYLLQLAIVSLYASLGKHGFLLSTSYLCDWTLYSRDSA